MTDEDRPSMPTEMPEAEVGRQTSIDAPAQPSTDAAGRQQPENEASESPSAQPPEEGEKNLLGPPMRLRAAAGRPRFLAVVLLAAVLLAAAHLRLLGLDWDQGQHLHPDERFLTMVEAALATPDSVQEYFDTQASTLNPRNQGHSFFVYGTFPITIVHFTAKAIGELDFPSLVDAVVVGGDEELPGNPPPISREPTFKGALGKLERSLNNGLIRLENRIDRYFYSFGTDYGRVYMVGRRLMTLADLLAIILLYGIGARLYDRRVGLLAATLAAFTAFMIQQAHFFTVDTAATFFVVLFFFAAVGMVRRGAWIDFVFTGLALGIALASKISVWPLVPLAILALVFADRRRGESLSRAWPRLLVEVVVLGVVSFATLRVAQPDMWVGPGWDAVVDDPARYSQVAGAAPGWWHIVDDHMPDRLKALLLPDPRWAENMHRVRDLTTGHGTDWPPNHQWWGRIAYWFPFRNMVLWGMGIALGLTAWAAWIVSGVQLARGKLVHLLPWLWVAFLFAYQGGQWTKTMRYFLPIYPMLILLAAWGLVAMYDWSKVPKAGRLRAVGKLFGPKAALAVVALVVGYTVVWGFMFSRIYSRDHSRVAGSHWIYHNIPAAMDLTVKGDEGPGRYMPVNHPTDLDFEGHNYVIAADDRLEAARVLVPTEEPVTVDGVQLSYVTDPAGDPAPETLRVWLTTDPWPDDEGHPKGQLAQGETTIDLSRQEERHVRIGFGEVELEPGGEYYLWVEVEGAPISGRPSILGYETRWDDAIPLGMGGYAAYDDPTTDWGEGFFGQVQMDLYAEDGPAKVEKLVSDLGKLDFVVSTSNRVYGSIAQLPTRFPMTLGYYDRLFGESMGFVRAADIHSYPSLGAFEVNDQSAEEAWHVYDHPKVDIFARTEEYSPEALREELIPLIGPEYLTWTTYAEESRRDRNPLSKALAALAGTVTSTGGETDDKPLETVMLSEEKRVEQSEAGTWSDIFNLDSPTSKYPPLAAALWYAVLGLMGILAFPLVAAAFPNLADKGWAVSRATALLLTSWLAWLVASAGLVPHGPLLVAASLAVVALLSGSTLIRQRTALGRWLRDHWRLIAFEEVLFALVFLLFLGIRIGNPDLWHPWYGGEKPMDLAYLNAVLKTRTFPPYDPWFAGGQMNYYYYGFVFVGALIQLTRVVPWVAYNLIIPSLAAMTGVGVFALAYHWARRLLRPRLVAGGVGVLGLVLAVVSGNLFQVQLVFKKLSQLSTVQFRSDIPGVETLVRAASGWYETVSGQAHLSIGTGNWYWDASRAIVVPSETPITEFPFFTFLYADLHAHMMALPITVLALTAAVSWAFPVLEELRVHAPLRAWQLLRLVLAAVAIGALWPTNTWDYPTYGLVAAGAIASAQLARHRRIGWAWLRGVLWRGLPLMALSLLFFAPYHLSYVRPYGSFEAWTRSKTPLDSYLTVHGIFLFAIVSLALVRMGRLLTRERLTALMRAVLVGAWAVAVLLMASVWWHTARARPEGEVPPSIWLPAVAAALLAVGLAWVAWPRLRAHERFAAWLFTLGLLLTQFVEYAVLAGDIGRMNTVFKFYIQVWILWSTLTAVAVAWLLPRLRRYTWGAWWSVGLAVLVLAGLLYPVTAARAKISDRFPAMGDAPREGYEENWRPGLSGIEFHNYAVYDDDGHSLHFTFDSEAIKWMLENVEGTPTILEGFREKGYRWGSRYSIHTGLPTVIGWDWHQKQQRNAVGHWVVDERTTDVREAYEMHDVEPALELLEQYDVEYVIVGEMERAFYDPAGLEKFGRMVAQGLAEIAYENPGVTIYRLTGLQSTQ